MPFTVPKEMASGVYRRVETEDDKGELLPGQRCLVCFETDPARYVNCTKGDCYAVGPFRQEVDPGTFTAPRALVSSFDLARRLRLKALKLDWEDDELRGQLLSRARELERGEPEVYDEDV